MMSEFVGDAILVVSAMLALACVIAHQITSRGRWMNMPEGRHFFVFMLVLAIVLTLSAIEAIAQDVFGVETSSLWFENLKIAFSCFLPVVLTWRLLLIVTANKWAQRQVIEKYRGNETDKER